MEQNLESLPKYTKTEELVNAITHIIGSVMGIAALVVGLIFASKEDNIYKTIGIIIYCCSLVLLYSMSSLYHFLPRGKTKRIFRIFDHCSIFLLIAGTYTPICFGPLMKSGAWGWILFGLVWVLAIIGIVLNATIMNKVKVLSMICYIFMGWCAILVIKPLMEHLDLKAFLWIFAGGIIYTIGAVLYIISKKKPIKYMHGIWHVFVLFGSLIQYIGILLYIIIE